MEAIAGPSTFTGPSSEVTTPGPYEEDSRHFAITASQVPKPTTSQPPPIPLPGPLPETGGMQPKDVKSIGTRFQEECLEADTPGPRLKSSRAWKGKGKELLNVEKEAKKPLSLLDLPVDVLKEIVREVTHTNDLTSLALCHSALHRLAVPHIYSRFDIVWPDSSTHAEPRSGVDALTYGLATLVMAEEIFGEAPAQRQAQSNRFAKSGHGRATETTIRRRRGNHYAQYTKKFSLGNGPADWVQEYLISKEGGKMLGTLVALAVARMRSLETFIWDMPTGILRDVWLALSSLDDRGDGEACRLEKVWVRWHDNSSSDHIISPPPPPYIAAPPPLHPGIAQAGIGNVPASIRPADMDRVEHPSFSVLPPLRSLSVLDIDELAYLDEMAVCIGNSLDKLRELRIGIARHAMAHDWVTVWEGDNLQQVDEANPTAGFLTIGEKRLGGVLGTLMGFVHDMRPNIRLPDRTRPRSSPRPELRVQSPPRSHTPAPLSMDPQDPSTSPQALATPPSIFSPGLTPPTSADAAFDSDPLVASSRCASPQPPSPSTITTTSIPDIDPITPAAISIPSLELPGPPPRQNTLRLDSLELERVPLSIPVLQKSLDWSRLTSLTILHCQNHEALWKTLRRTFTPTPKSPTYPTPRRISASTSTPRGKGSRASIAGAGIEMEYHLGLKRLHTNAVSPSLVSFLKETLAPNSLETLFLQESRTYTSPVSLEALFKGPLKRHRLSLKKVLLDGAEGGDRRWMLSREVLAWICAKGRMPALRELGVGLSYRDWHFFLQHLPSMPQLRSLYIPFLADHVHGPATDSRELALQVVDIVALRPEVELCYLGIGSKCFEILEAKREWDAKGNESFLGLDGAGMEDDDEDGEDMDGDGEETESEDVEEEEVADEDEDEDDDDDDDDDGDGEDGDSDFGGADGRSDAAKLRLREILFYDDKVAVFRARHGRL